MLEVRLLGKFEIKLDVNPITISSRPAQSLFAYLILNAGTLHRREKLAGLLWPDSLEETARDNLRHALWRVRKALQSASPARFLLANDLTIAFDRSGEYWLDTAALEKLNEHASSDELIAVLSEYHGELLPGFYDEWVLLEREHLNSVFEHHMARLMSLLQAEKRWLDILDWAERWISLGQKPEPAYRALMSAHAAKGDMSKVAATYERCLKSLKELGVEPSEQTRALYERLKAGKEIFETGSTVFVGKIGERPPKTNLPMPLTSFIGREKEVEEVVKLVVGNRLVTLIGPPGIGKTRLSLEAARAVLSDFPDGVFFVALDALEDSGLVVPTVVQTLGFAETERKPPIERLKDGIGGKQLLLVLDNLEHIIEDAARFISDLLLACPQLKILTTSREALRVSGEWLYPVPVLNIPGPTQLESIDMQEISQFAALRLFLERARAVRSDFSLDSSNVQAVATICNQLDGLPLAIELIAARIRLMSPQFLLSHLSDRFTLNVDGMRAVPARQRTLNNAISWSYNLLSAEEQKLFARLSVFLGGFTFDAAEAIFSRIIKEKSLYDLIASLLDKSLILRTRDDRGESRFTMLVTIQRFALDRLRSMDEDIQVRDWHLAYFLDLAEQANKEIHGPDQVEWMNRLEAEHSNYRSALDWSVSNQKTEGALRLFCALAWPWLVRSQYSEARNWFDKLRALPEINNYPLLYARLLNHIGRHISALGDFHEARSFLEESRTIWLKFGGEVASGLAETLDWLGMVARWGERDIQKAQALFEQGIIVYRKCGDQWGEAESLLHLGIAASDRHDDVLALSLYEQSLAIFHQLGDLWGSGRVYESLGNLLLRRHEYERARSIFEQALAADQQLQFKEGVVSDLGDLGEVCYREGDIDRAVASFEESLALSRQFGLKLDTAVALYSLGLIALRPNEYSKAAQHFTEYFSVYHNIDEKWSTVDFLSGLAAVAAGTNRAERAAKLIGAARGLHENVDGFVSPMDQEEIVRHIHIAREQLGEAAFEALVAEGRAMTLDQAIEFALKEA